MCMWNVIIYFLGNTRIISQSALQTFQEEMGKVLKDPYKVFHMWLQLIVLECNVYTC